MTPSVRIASTAASARVAGPGPSRLPAAMASRRGT